MKLLIATKNKGKFNEITGVLGGASLDGNGGSDEKFEIVFLGDLVVPDADFVEDGATHAENAYKKAKYYFDKLGGDFDFVLGEDSGIYVDALADELGLQTRRWGAGETASDDEWLGYFMSEMSRRASSDDLRGAKFVCSACFMGKGFVEYFEGETFGKIVREKQADILTGLPLSSVFLPEGYDKVYAALSREEKNAISHRGRAIAKVKNFLINLKNGI